MDDTLRDFEDWLAGVPLAPSTIGTYKSRLKGILQLCEVREWNPLDLSVLQLKWICAQFSPGRSTRAHLRYVFRHYWQMSGVDDGLVETRVRSIPMPPHKPGRYRGLEPDAAARLEQAAVEFGHPKGTIVLIGLYLALRREEIVTMRWSHFDDKMEWVDVTGKGSRTRHVPVAMPLRIALKPHRVGTGPVFPSPASNRTYLHTGTAYNWTQQVADRAGIGHVHPHMLRHTCLATMNDETKDLRTTQAFAGHSDIQSTVIYTRSNERNLLAAVATLDYRIA